MLTPSPEWPSKKPEPDQGAVLTVTEVAARLGISSSRVRRLVADGRLPAAKHGALWIIRATDLDKVRERRPGRPTMLTRVPPR